MKKIIQMRFTVIPLLAIIFIIAACSSRNKEEADRTIVIRENMFATTIDDINLNPRLYLGETIRIEGMFRHNRWQGQDIYRVIRFGPGCCGDEDEIGFEFTMDPDFPETNRFSSEFRTPRQGDWIEVVGELRRYDISGFPFLYIATTELNFPEVRGAEVVTR